jgi:hypothetical protein
MHFGCFDRTTLVVGVASECGRQWPPRTRVIRLRIKTVRYIHNLGVSTATTSLCQGTLEGKASPQVCRQRRVGKPLQVFLEEHACIVIHYNVMRPADIFVDDVLAVQAHLHPHLRCLDP